MTFGEKTVTMGKRKGTGREGAAGRRRTAMTDIIFTSDIHSHLNSFPRLSEGREQQTGGLARMKTLVDEQRKKNPDTLYLDGGDFSMGTLVQTVFEEEAAELRTLGMLGCDATTFGNHEFDYRTRGLVRMMRSAMDSEDPLPALLLCNVDWEQGGKEAEPLREVFGQYGVRPYEILERGGVRIALMGVFGKDALVCAPTCQLKLADPVAAVRRTVEEIRREGGADLYICISHGGTAEKPEHSEDEILARKVPQLDLIISGHSHTVLREYIRHGDTFIVSCGEYGAYLGYVSMERKKNGRWAVRDYHLQPVTGEIPADPGVQRRIDSFMESVDRRYLFRYGYTRDQVLAVNGVDFSSIDQIREEHTEQNLGSVVADAYLYAAARADGQEGKGADVAIVPGGTLRETYAKGPITVEDVFQSFSLGIGPDGVPGYPLVRAWLTGRELKLAAEVDASISDAMPMARLFMSGLRFTFNPNRVILNKVTDISLVDDRGQECALEDNRLYSVVSDLYTGQMLSSITGISHGLLSLQPKDAEGNPLENFEDAILFSGGQEMKAWVAIARYLSSFEQNDRGIAQIPEAYAKKQGRKVVSHSRKPGELLRNPNRYSAAIYSAGGVLAVSVLFLLLAGIFLRGKPKR